jgi:medium-chain acyl-[acyl-carrier-protein] hydrolase
MTELVTTLDAMTRAWTDEPVVLFGHSMGAWVMFELARRLRDRVVHLFVSAQPGPRLADHFPPSSSSEDVIVDWIRSMDGAPEDILTNRAFMEAYLPAMRADLTVCESYRFRATASLTCLVTAFSGEQETTTSSRDVAAWRPETTGLFDQVNFPGGHLFLHDHLSVLTAEITARVKGCVR